MSAYDAPSNEAPPLEPEILSPAKAIPNVKLPTGMSSQMLVIASLSVALVVLLVLLIARRKSKSKGTALLLLGPSDAGKTAIFTSLVYNQTLPTQTSMQTNSAVISIPDTRKTIRIIDIPGHPRVRHQFKESLDDAKAIAFVVDASTVSRNGAAVAEHLHEVLHALTSLPPSASMPALLIVAHKADALKAAASASASQLAINRVRTILERELEKRRQSHAGVGIEGLGEDGKGEHEGEIGMGDALECTGGGEFRFEQWEGGEVQFIGTSTTAEKRLEKASDESDDEVDGLRQLWTWMAELP